jgi:hypothetical protein
MKEEKKVKILGIVEKNSGSHYHRVYLPLLYLNNKQIEINGETHTIETYMDYRELNNFYFTVDDLNKYDIIVNNYTTLNHPALLESLCKKHNVKKWLDIDDFPRLPDNHVNVKEKSKEIMDLTEQYHYKSITCADFVTCSTTPIMEAIVNICSLVGDIPNYLPLEGQFELKEKVKRNGKINIGFCGSVSHYNDLEEFKDVISAISEDKEIRTRCKWVIAGFVKGNKYWSKIEKLFKSKRMSVKFVDACSPSDYMKLYDEIDILFNPLQQNYFSTSKSALKLLECSIKSIPMLSNQSYLNKEFSAFILCREKKDWIESIKNLIYEDNYLKIGKELSEVNLKNNNFDYRIEKLKEGLKVVLENNYKSDANLKLYGITYKDDQYTPFEQYNNSKIDSIEKKSYLFEWNPIIDIVDNFTFSEEDYLGIFSWKFTEKTGVSEKMLDKAFRELKVENYDIINLSPRYFVKNYLATTEQFHPGFMDLFNLICKDLNLEVLEPSFVVYSNFYVAKYSIYKKFVNEVIKPAIELIETKYKDLAWKDSTYKGLSSESLKNSSGLDYYPFQTFILERLMSIWVENNPSLKTYQLV